MSILILTKKAAKPFTWIVSSQLPNDKKSLFFHFVEENTKAERGQVRSLVHVTAHLSDKAGIGVATV